MHTFPTLLIAALLSFGVAACQQEGEEGEETAPADTTAMEAPAPAEEVTYQFVVTNPMPHAMNVSATMPDGSQVQLGTVPASGESSFNITGSVGESVTVVAVDEENTHEPTGTVTLPAGQTTLSWTIQ
jgi:hypothetical protein